MSEQPSTMIHVLIVDDQELIRTGLSMLMDNMDGIEVAGTARDAAEALAIIMSDVDIDVALVDARMPQVSGPELIAQLHERFPRIKCILLTAFDEDDNLVGALKAGAVGYLLKDVSAADLEQAIRVAAGGGKVLGQSAVDHAMQLIAESGDDGGTVNAGFNRTTSVSTAHRLNTTAGIADTTIINRDNGTNANANASANTAEIQMLLAMLTDRERQIAELVARGKTNSEIADTVFLSAGTVKNHVSHIFHTLGVRNRTELTALLSGIIE